MAGVIEGDHPLGPQEEDEATEEGFVAGHRLGVEPLVGRLIRPLVLEPGLSHRRDDDPVTREVDRVAVSLVHRRHLPPGVRSVERVFRPFPLDGHDEAFQTSGAEVAEDSVSQLAIDRDMLLVRGRPPVAFVDGPGVAQTPRPMSARKSGSNSRSLWASARPDANIPAHLAMMARASAGRRTPASWGRMT